MKTAPGFIRGGVSASLLAFLSRYPGVSVEALVRGADIDPAHLGDPEALLRPSAFIELLERAAIETGDRCFAVGFTAQMPWRDLGLLGYLMLHSPTFGAGTETACRYLSIQQTVGVAALHLERASRAPRARFTYTMHFELGPCGQHVESVLTAYVRFARDALGDQQWAPAALHFRHPRPADPRRHEAYFRCPVNFSAGSNAVDFDPALLERPIQAADDGLFPILRRHADEVVARIPAGHDFPGEVRRAVITALSAGEAKVETVARSLATSPRSLQRRLKDGGLSFHDVLDETRQALSRRYLADTSITLTDAAFLLGYSDLSAFSRAFRRWTGQTPLEARRAVAR